MYTNIVSKFDLKKGDSIWLSSDIIKFALFANRQGKDFDINMLIDEFQKSVGNDGTIMIPTFSFEFSNKGFYDYKKTKGNTGVIGNVALDRNDFKRTLHPMHSFAVWGKDKDYLCSMDNRNSFGIDSPFGYCMRNSVKQIMLGTDYVHAMTFVHYVESTCNVWYRFIKKFTGIYIDDNGVKKERTYDYMARNLDVCPVEVFNKIGRVLEEKNISKRIDIDGITSYIVNLKKSYPIICSDILENDCKNIYEFIMYNKKPC